MAKYCDQCGKALPDGVEVCPACNVPATQTDAALFTRLTSEPEVWKAPGEKERKPRRARTRAQKERLGFGIAAVVVLAFLAFAILFTRPVPRVLRAVRAGDYDRAVEIYWGSGSLAEKGSERIERAILKEAQVICDDYAAGTVSADDAASALSRLGSLGTGAADLLAEHFETFRALCLSQDHLAEGETLFAEGRYLDAREEFRLVREDDADYQTAQQRAADCLVAYGEDVAAEARSLAAEKDFPAAIACLRAGNSALEAYNTYSPAIDQTLSATFADYEAFLLEEAGNLSELGDHAKAAALLQAGIDEYKMTSEEMTGARDRYLLLDRENTIAVAAGRAAAHYDAAEFAEAFAGLDALKASLEGDSADIDAEIAALETRFADDKITAAEKLFITGRDALPDAIAILDDAIAVRPLARITTYRDDIAQYLPLDLVTAVATDKTGTVFRSDGEFESLDGTTYRDGWMWGENEAEIAFPIDGAYDLLTAAFTVRRDDEEPASGWFEVYGDGELLFTSETLKHEEPATVPVSLDVSGCAELTIRFLSDYVVSVAEDGYCYHGLCTPQLTKNMPEQVEDALPLDNKNA